MASPLTITLLTPRERSVLTLPESCGGQFYVTDHTEDDAKHVLLRNLISIEGKSGEWVANSTKVADVCDSQGTPVKSLNICGNQNFYVNVKQEKGSAYIAKCELTTKETRTFAKYYVENNSDFKVGRGQDCDLTIESNLVSSEHLNLTFRDNKWILRDLNSSNGTYVNNKRVAPNINVQLAFGDAIYVMGVTLVVCNGFIAFNNPGGVVTTSKKLLPLSFEAEEVSNEVVVEEETEPNYFYRSPRFMREIENQKIVIEAPPTAQQQNDMPLITTIGPAITMGMASLFSGVMMAYNTISNNGSVTQALPMMAMSISMLLGMCLWPFITRKYQNAKWIKDERKRQVKYRDYLDRMKEKILRAGEVQSEILNENIIDAKQAAKRVFDVSRNLWERTPSHSDFLNVRLGTGTLPIAAEVEFPKTPFSLDNDSLLDAIGELKREEHTVKNVPIPFSLIDNKVAGIVGERKRVLKYVKLLVSQIVSLHSYDEVKLVFLTSEEEREAWEWARLVPHVFDDTHTSRYFSTNLEEARSLSMSFKKLLASRIENKLAFEEEQTTPYYVVISANRDIALKTEFIDNLLHVPENYGFSLLCLYDELKFLPKECKSVIDVDAETNTAKLYDKDDTSGKVTEISLEDNLSEDLEDSLFVNVANIELDLDSSRYMLPKSISFLDMFQVGKVEHLNVGARWSENTAATTLTTPVGVDQNGEQFMLDLHEKVHGPHGLVAGMTGSGKSEFIITYILSLAVNYNPDEVAFVLIDYKGGGLAGAFDNDKVRLPHLAGTITNLDGAAINRSLVSIESELKRRQAVFNHARDVSNAGTMDIYSYQRLYREGVVKEAVPHLFIISDEFAELKQQQPEFMEQLISTARIGRSLGVHLILATQKPSGVVNDQIWSNSKFKVCLKVQDKADSQEMIKRPEAAELVDTGRFYLQVGYNEYFALGQSAWCGAPYVEQEEYVANKRDERVVAINNLGAEIAVAAPVDETAQRSDVRQIVAIISHICDVANERKLKARELWLPPLKDVQFVDDIESKYASEFLPTPTSALIGEIDDPAHQRRLPLVANTDGGIVVYGVAGSGKFTFLSSVLYSLIKHNTPEEFNAYVIDCGAETLNAFRGAPHVGDVVLASEKDKIVNLLKMINSEIKTRKKNFSGLGVGIEEYRKQTGEICPEICVVINGIGAFLELYPETSDMLSTLTREAPKYGVNFVVSGSTANDMGFRLSQNFATSYVLRMNDENDYSSVLGRRANGALRDVKGRGYALYDAEVLEFQTAYAGKDSSNVFGQMRDWCNALGAENEGYFAPKVPILPDVVDKNFLQGSAISTSKFPVGVGKASLKTIEVTLPKDAISFVLGNEMEGICDFATCMADVLQSNDNKVAVLCASPDFDEESLAPLFEIDGVAVFKDAHAFVETLANGSLDADVCIMFDVANMLSSIDFEDAKSIKDHLANLKKGATSFVMCATGTEISGLKFDEWVSNSLNVGASIWIGNGFADQSCFKIGRFTMDLYDDVAPMFGYVLVKQKPVLTKLLSYSGGE